MSERTERLLRDLAAAIREEVGALPDNILTLGEELASARQNSRMSLQEVADAAGFTKGHVWEVEKGRSRNPTIGMVSGLSKALGVPFLRLAQAALNSSEAADISGAQRSELVLPATDEPPTLSSAKRADHEVADIAFAAFQEVTGVALDGMEAGSQQFYINFAVAVLKTRAALSGPQRSEAAVSARDEPLPSNHDGERSAGWVLVPREPTGEMLRLGEAAANDKRWAWCGLGERIVGEGLDGMRAYVLAAYRAMLAALPQAPDPSGPQDGEG